MEFTVHGVRFTFDGRWLTKWSEDGRVVACGDMSLQTYAYPRDVDAFRFAVALVEGRA